MFNLLKFETFNNLSVVENHLKNVDSILFLRIKRIDVYCYR